MQRCGGTFLATLSVFLAGAGVVSRVGGAGVAVVLIGGLGAAVGATALMAGYLRMKEKR